MRPPSDPQCRCRTPPRTAGESHRRAARRRPAHERRRGTHARRQEVAMTVHTETTSRAGAAAPASLYSDRTQQLGTENAFKIGPYIRAVEEQGHKVVKCNLGE